MDDRRSTDAAWRFDEFELDVPARELRYEGRLIRLQDQPFEILRLLLERPGEVVSRDALRQRLWPDGTFVDFEHSLNAAIKRLRAALGDDADHPRYVETVPRRGYRFIGTQGLATGTREDPRPRVAVLPFTDLSAPPGHSYLSDGLTAEMIVQLGRLGRGHIAVLARWSSMSLKGLVRSISDIRTLLRADYLLEGSVRCEGDQVRVIASLIDAAAEVHLWTETYDALASGGYLRLQVEVAERIARSLHLELGAGRGATVHDSPLTSAYRAYLEGLHRWNAPGTHGVREAMRCFEAALALDPRFASPSASLGRMHVGAAEQYLERPDVAVAIARRAADRALTLDPSVADAHIVRADALRILDWDWPAAEQAYRTAIDLNPSSEAAHRKCALLLAALGRHREALDVARRALALDPLCVTVVTSAAWVSYLAGDYGEAVTRCRGILDTDRRSVTARRVLAAALVQIGRIDEAIGDLQALCGGESPDPVALLWLAHALGSAGRTSDAEACIAQVVTGNDYVPAYHVALAHAGVGAAAEATRALRVACDQRDPALVSLAGEPRFAVLHADPEFGELLERLRLQPPPLQLTG